MASRYIPVDEVLREVLRDNSDENNDDNLQVKVNKNCPITMDIHRVNLRNSIRHFQNNPSRKVVSIVLFTFIHTVFT